MNFVSEAKQIPSYEFGVLAVRTLGGKSPKWAEKFPPLTDAPNVEIWIVREEPADFVAALPSLEPQATGRPWRLLVIDEAFPAEKFQCAGAVWIVSAAPRDLDVIAEACVQLAKADLLIGVCLADAIDVAGGRDNPLPFGRGAVIRGMYGDRALRSAKAALRSSAEAGFDGGIAVIHAWSKGDDKKASLSKLDAFATSLFSAHEDNDKRLTAYCGASAFAWIVIAFKKSRRRRQ